MPTYAIAVLLGCLLQLQQASLWPRAAYGALLAAGVGGSFVLLLRQALPDAARSCRSAVWRISRAAVAAAAGAALAFGLAGWRAHPLLADRLAPTLEGQVLQVRGVVAGLPVLYADSTRFTFDVPPPRAAGLPSRLSLSWYAARNRSGLAEPPPRVRPGEVWQLPVRLKRPHGTANPGGSDQELALLRDGIGATGTVSRAGAPPIRLGRRSTLSDRLAALRDRLRARMFDALHPPATSPPPASVGAPVRAAGPSQGEDRPLGGQRASASVGAASDPAGTIVALALGDQAAIAPTDWATYRTTGVAHLMSISGLHITLLAWLAAQFASWAWRQTARLPRPWTLHLPAPTVGAWAALGTATIYAMLAGWGVPAQRTLLMLAVVLLLRQRGLRAHWIDVTALALVAVLLWDPWAALQPGFWLSFVAVGMLFLAGDGERRDPLDAAVAPPSAEASPRPLAAVARRLRAAAHAQWVATIALVPLTLLFFRQIALLSPLANALAIPLVTLFVAPLAVFGLLLPAPLDGWAWQLAALAQQGLDAVLRQLAALPLARWHAAVPDAASLTLAMLGVIALALPWGWRLRLPGALLLLPLATAPGLRPADGEVEAWFADVGQGMAVVVRTARHTLVYDTGPQQAPGVDAGERVVLPLLHGLGDRGVDRVVVSHDDGDHAGGAAAIARAHPDAVLLTSAPPAAAARFGFSRVEPCVAGRRWVWDGVTFSLHNPPAGGPVRNENAASCVLHVAGRGGSLLLAGDIDARQERELAAAGALPYADVLLVPHHGSRTSSSDALLDTVMPRIAVVQAGYRNPHGHPHPAVVERLRERGITLRRTDLEGALYWRDTAADAAVGWRALHPRYWRSPPPATDD